VSEDYIKLVFEVMDGKVKFKDLDKKRRGRKSGYEHNPDTKEKIANKMKGKVKAEETKEKISKSLVGREKTYDTRQKISRSKTKNSIAKDLLETYSGVVRERDVVTSTYDYLANNPKRMEACDWIKENFELLNKGQEMQETRTMRWEADLNADMKKEEINLDDIGIAKDYWD
jgi:hypothetical protein